MSNEIKIYTQEEIEIFLSGDRREVDRLLLTGLNNLAKSLLPHMEREEKTFDIMGNDEVIRTRAEWIDAQVIKMNKRSAMMQKVTEQVGVWVLIAFLGFVAFSVWDHFVDVVKTHQAGRK